MRAEAFFRYTAPTQLVIPFGLLAFAAIHRDYLQLEPCVRTIAMRKSNDIRECLGRAE